MHESNRTPIYFAALAVLLTASFAPVPTRAHCDSLEGPVVQVP
jgi:hypothetical protein